MLSKKNDPLAAMPEADRLIQLQQSGLLTEKMVRSTAKPEAGSLKQSYPICAQHGPPADKIQ